MVATVKFSQFLDGGNVLAGDTIVGLRGGVNTKFLFTGGGGGGGGVTVVIPQAPGALVVGEWVRVDATGTYVQAQADTPQNAETLGVIIATTPASITIQQSGYITAAMGIFVGLIAGDVYFLDTAVPGGMVNIDATVNGTVSRPVFVPDSPTSGWVVPYRGLVVGGAAPQGGGGGGTTPELIVTVNQNLHGFGVGDVVRVDTPVAGQAHYIKAFSDNLANAQAVGIVIQIVNPNQFVLQFSGYNIGAVTVDDIGNPIAAAGVYYVSQLVAGMVSLVQPTAPGLFSKPIYVSEQTVGTTGVIAGYILDQRPLNSASVNNPIVHTITQVNAFNPGNWVYIQADNTYALAQANTLASAQVAGVVLTATGAEFTIQQSGYVAGIVTQDDVPAPLASGPVYYLSQTVAGAISPIAPAIAGQISKPCYVQEQLIGNVGEILPQRPIIVTVPFGPGTGWTQISTQTVVNVASVSIPNMALYYRYMIVLENVIPVNNNVPLQMRTSSNNGIAYDFGVADYTWSSYANVIATVYGITDNRINITSNSVSDLVSNIVAYGGISGTITTINPANILYSKQFNMETSHRRNPDGLVIGGLSLVGARIATNIVNAVQFFFSAGNIASGTFKLYGTGV